MIVEEVFHYYLNFVNPKRRDKIKPSCKVWILPYGSATAHGKLLEIATPGNLRCQRYQGHTLNLKNITMEFSNDEEKDLAPQTLFVEGVEAAQTKIPIKTAGEVSNIPPLPVKPSYFTHMRQ